MTRAMIIAAALVLVTSVGADPLPKPKPVGPGGSCPHGYFTSGSFCVPSQGAQDAVPKPPTIGASAGKYRANWASRMNSRFLHRAKAFQFVIATISAVCRCLSPGSCAGSFSDGKETKKSRSGLLRDRVIPHAGIDVPGLVEPVVRRRGAVGADVPFEPEIEPDVAHRRREREDFPRPFTVAHVGW